MEAVQTCSRNGAAQCNTSPRGIRVNTFILCHKFVLQMERSTCNAFKKHDKTVETMSVRVGGEMRAGRFSQAEKSRENRRTIGFAAHTTTPIEVCGPRKNTCVPLIVSRKALSSSLSLRSKIRDAKYFYLIQLLLFID